MVCYIFRIDEIQESPNAIHHITRTNFWTPSTDPGANIRLGSGASGRWFLYNNQQITPLLQGLPGDAQHYKTFSVYYSEGDGFWILRGDATGDVDEGWHRLLFDSEGNDYSSYLTNAGHYSTLIVQRSNQTWPHMLLPPMNHNPTMTSYAQYGGLVGDLPIFLALVAFSVRREEVAGIMTSIFANGAWRTHNRPHGRTDGRGVVVYVYTCPGSTSQDLQSYEQGRLGKYYY